MGVYRELPAAIIAVGLLAAANFSIGSSVPMLQKKARPRKISPLMATIFQARGQKRRVIVTSRKINLASVERFLKDFLPEMLTEDLLALRMIKEADLECCVYHHIRLFLQKDQNWKLLARKHAQHTGHYIDLILFRKGYPRIAIELKWNEAQIPSKDRHSLRRAIRRLRVNKAYFITTLVGTTALNQIRKTKPEKNRLFEIEVPLPLTGKELKDWRAERKAFTSKMVRGKGRQK
jgi:hypothetical protein